MALERGKLSNVQRVAAAATVGIITCASSKKVYIKSILCHYPGGGGINTAAAHVYVVPNGDAFSDADTGTSVNRVFDVDVQSGETVLLEPSYPIVLDTTGDAIFVGTGDVGAGATYCNFMISGDKEA
jgi:hypothetical protein|tara:strand:- start:779 stop:1159 length:381 start_codon:yes stop_codon:yes gene_type:complete